MAEEINLHVNNLFIDFFITSQLSLQALLVICLLQIYGSGLFVSVY